MVMFKSVPTLERTIVNCLSIVFVFVSEANLTFTLTRDALLTTVTMARVQ